MIMKILSWNVNGIRAAIRKGFLDFLKKEDPDILALQEIKISDISRAEENFDFSGYREFWNSARRPGYSGTAILVKDGLKVLGEVKFPNDDEGRVQILEFKNFYFTNVYFPNANHELSRLEFKLKFNDRLLRFLKKLDKKKPLIICGDYNVAHEEIDLARPRENVGNPGFTNEERAWMDKFLQAGFVDVFRKMHPQKVQYSWWSFRAGARARNVGWRIDYFCTSANISNKIKSSFILDHQTGSDHAPVGIEI
ncbi:exodeoxyribonuclease III [Candidatus Falkowbacteria bacterium]|nr:exodeoxyribonuclease III [Candidatus Falkowbacteria bacterium]